MRVFSTFLFLTLFSITAWAQQTGPASPQPVEISADKSLEWDRKNRTYTAHENVVVVQGQARIQSDTLTARYKDGASATDIYELEALGRVIILSPPYTATGDKGVYNVKTGNAVLTGEHLKITAPDTVVTANDQMEFLGQENTLTAKGGATAVRSSDSLKADVLSVFFAKNTEGKLGARKITARGHVTIKTAKETAQGDEGTYDISAQKAVLTGKVRILQGKNWLTGTRADVDMATGISRLSGTGNPETEGRVKGMFYPAADAVPQPKGQTH